MIKRVVVDVIPHEEQRYDTVGDYTFDDENKVLHISVSDTGDHKEAMAVAIHELVEFVLVQERGIPFQSIDEFDVTWEAGKRTCDIFCLCTEIGEPGSCLEAPYYHEHAAATAVERELISQWHMDWETYDKHLYNLNESQKPDGNPRL